MSESLDEALLPALVAGDTAGALSALESGASPEARTGNGWSALGLAAGNGDEQTTLRLLEAGADPNGSSFGVGDGGCLLMAVARGGRGMTGLHLAVEARHPACLRVLLEAGAELLAKDDLHRTAEEAAAEEEDWECQAELAGWRLASQERERMLSEVAGAQKGGRRRKI